MFEYDIKSLDIRKIAESGQTFRMVLDAEKSAAAGCDVYRCLAMDRVCFAGGGRVWYEGLCSADQNEEEADAFWKNYFDLDTDYESMIDGIDPDDTYLTAAAEYGRGIRILKQDPWEMLITFIISQRRSIPSIKTCVEALCRRWGKSLACGHYAFPTPEELAAADLDELSCCSLGYRTEYVYLAAQGVASGSIDLEAWKRLSDEELMQKLLALRGVGPKVANCVSLFGFYRIGAFPIDVWIDRVLKEHYPMGFPMERYKGHAGVMQQYMFYAARS